MVFAIETLHNTYFNATNRKVTFANSLQELINKQQKLFHDYIYDPCDFCKRVKLQRNFLAHKHSETSNSAIDEKYYPYFISMLKLVFETSFFPVLRITQQLIELAVKRNFTYQNFRSRVKDIKIDLVTNA